MVAGPRILGDPVEKGGLATAAMADQEQLLEAFRGIDGGDKFLDEGLEEVADEEFFQRLPLQCAGLEVVGGQGKGGIRDFGHVLAP
uniref:Uncharacterized protein n=1 Tax=Candidatus Kentrum sp. TC TaxID=2126339 RepID=A0A450ZYY2_9GAMM|nr:MAG: hypothetical protein BECKTC1821D_GA0114238_109311 [Candidatus Kentron sp. TC]VFK59014.1 MAG: hypothetical protein BECKTC1821F_GA0114240_102832 [Candidatus Kentron sp. TC]